MISAVARTMSRPRAPDRLRRGDALLSNTASLLVARYAVAAMGWLGTLIIVRTLSVEQFGTFTFVFSLLGIVSVFSDLSLGRAALRGLVDEHGDQATFAGSFIVLRIILGLLSYLSALAFVVFAGYPRTALLATAVAGVVILLATPSHAVEAVFQAHLRMRPVAVGNVLGQLAQLGLVVALAARGGSVVIFVLPAVACEVVILAWRVQALRRVQRIRLRIDRAQWVALLREAAPLAAGQILATMYYRIDSVMLSRLDSFDAVAIYGVAYKFVDIVHYLPSALMVPALAMMVRAWPHDPGRFRDVVGRSLTVLCVVGVLVTVEFALFAGPVIRLLYGSRYTAGGGAARLLVGAECLAAFGTLAYTALIAQGRRGLYPLAALAGLILNVSLNLRLIPARSYGGAATATLITEMVVVAIVMVPVVRMRPSPPPWPVLIRCVAAGAAAAAVAAALRAATIWPVAALGGLATYLVVLWALGVIPSRTWLSRCGSMRRDEASAETRSNAASAKSEPARPRASSDPSAAAHRAPHRPLGPPGT